MDKKVYVNGMIFTSDDSNLHADSLIIEDGKVVWVGKAYDMPEMKFTEIVDLEGRCVLPGFVDAHMHVGMMADQINQISCLPPAIKSMNELIDEIRKRAEHTQEGEWIEGWGLDENKFPEKRLVNRYDLDTATREHPVAITRTCSHIRCVNSKALELAGIGRDTQDPDGGEIQRDSNGDPTGILIENARDLVTPVIPSATHNDKINNIIKTGEILASQGITTVVDMGSLEGEDLYEYFVEASQKGFKQHIALYYIWDYFADNERLKIDANKIKDDAKVRIAGLKLLADGSISGRTAWMSKPYLGSEDEFGMSVCSDELMDSAIEFCKKNALQLSIHAMGGQAIDRAVNRINKETSWTLQGVPFARVEHVTDPSDTALEIAADKGIYFVTQPNFLYAEIEAYKKNLGTSWLTKTYPVKYMLDKGVKIALSTDAPATAWAQPSDPIPCLKCAVTRKAHDGTDCGQSESINIETAIKLYTKDSAEAAGFRNVGMLKEGYSADFIILDCNIFDIDGEDIDKVKILKTYKEGICIFEA